MDIQDTYNIITTIQEEAYNRHGLTSRPVGPGYCLLVLEMAHTIIEQLSYKDLTEDVENLLYLLTDNNYHTGRKACELAIELLRKEESTK